MRFPKKNFLLPVVFLLLVLLNRNASSYPHIYGYTFSLSRNWVVFDCSQNSCEAEVVFSITPVTDLHGEALEEFCRNSEPHVLPVVRSMALSFDPCFTEIPDNYHELPDGYHSAVRLDAPGSFTCSEAGNSLCLMEAHPDPESVRLSDPQACIYEGRIVFRISGAENVARCRNLPHRTTDPENPPQKIVAPSDVPAYVHVNVIPQINVPDRLYYHGTYLTLEVRGEREREAGNPSFLEAYEIRIRVVEADPITKVATLKAYILDAMRHYTSFPSNVRTLRGSWIRATPVGGSGDPFESTRVATVRLGGSELTVRYILDVEVLLQDGEGDTTSHRLTFKSNEIRFFTPVSCGEDTAVCVYRPPILRPVPPESLVDRVDRPIFTGLVDTDGDGQGDTSDYSSYTGTACSSCLSTDRSYVDSGYWRGGAARDGVWYDWVADPSRGRVGFRRFVFKNARPWDVYVYCPRTEIVRPSGGNPYDACLDPRGLVCPESAGTGRIVEGEEYTVVWTADGWQCWNFLCHETTSEIPDAEDLRCD